LRLYTDGVNKLDIWRKKINKKIFSLPFNISIGEKEVNETFIPFLKTYNDFIYDIYFACYVPPFINDAMGLGNVFTKDVYREIFKFMMWCQERFGIKVSGTFNNFTVLPNYENLSIFIKNLKPFYSAGLRSITIPHTHWARIGDIKEAYPDMFIKNTVLRQVYDPQEYANCAESGFDLINIDCSNIRDRENLVKLKKVYDKYQKPISILVNEVCRGRCPVKNEHYSLNCSIESKEGYFKQKISDVSCKKWRREIPCFHLMIANMPICRKDFEEILEYVQVLKLHGRATKELFYDSIDIIKQYADNTQDVIIRSKKQQFDMYLYDKKIFLEWNEYIKNCKFQCWQCSMCERLHSTAKAKIVRE
jgi:hypothetical protein